MSQKLDIIFSIDPGTSKIGLAVVDSSSMVIHKEIIKNIQLLEETLISLISLHNPDVIILGNGTGSKKIGRFLESKFHEVIPIELVDERKSTEEARKEYYLRHSPIRRFLLTVAHILGVSAPDFDDDVAVILAKRYLKAKSGQIGGQPD
jgi:RNase H-fold protein (predicted Holliday junction resolvase)